MHIVISGGSGFVGTALQKQLLSQGHRLTILTRHPSRYQASKQVQYVEWLTSDSQPEKQLGEVDAIVNLAGESINGGRWTNKKKERIMQSRISATKEILRIMKALPTKPEILVNASAVGYYGMSEKETFTETDYSDAQDFLATVVKKWEGLAAEAEDLGVRTVYARFGIILGKDGGVFPLMSLPYKFGVGGTVGTGKQWVSWVHIEDVAGLIAFSINERTIHGPLNITAPEPMRMAEFGKLLGHALHRPHWLPVPSFALKIALGEMSEMLLNGQRVIPEKALESAYSFRFPTLKMALDAIGASK